MGGRPTVVGLLAVAAAAWCAGAIAPPPAAAEFRIPGLFEFKPKAAQRKQVFRPTIPKRNPSRVTAGVSAAAVSPEIADNSEAMVVVGTASAASVALALPAPERKEAAAETQAPEIETAAMDLRRRRTIPLRPLRRPKPRPRRTPKRRPRPSRMNSRMSLCPLPGRPM